MTKQGLAQEWKSCSPLPHVYINFIKEIKEEKSYVPASKYRKLS